MRAVLCSVFSLLCSLFAVLAHCPRHSTCCALALAREYPHCTDMMVGKVKLQSLFYNYSFA